MCLPPQKEGSHPPPVQGASEEKGTWGDLQVGLKENKKGKPAFRGANPYSHAFPLSFFAFEGWQRCPFLQFCLHCKSYRGPSKYPSRIVRVARAFLLVDIIYIRICVPVNLCLKPTTAIYGHMSPPPPPSSSSTSGLVRFLKGALKKHKPNRSKGQLLRQANHDRWPPFGVPLRVDFNIYVT